MNEILQYLKNHGECSDKEIAEGIGIPIADLHLKLAALSAKNQIMMCQSSKFVKGKETKCIICRIAGYVPPAAPGRKKTGIVISK
jgi:hypothetical protein